MPMVSAGFTARWSGDALPESDFCCMDEANEES